METVAMAKKAAQPEEESLLEIRVGLFVRDRALDSAFIMNSTSCSALTLETWGHPQRQQILGQQRFAGMRCWLNGSLIYVFLVFNCLPAFASTSLRREHHFFPAEGMR